MLRDYQDDLEQVIKNKVEETLNLDLSLFHHGRILSEYILYNPEKFKIKKSVTL